MSLTLNIKENGAKFKGHFILKFLFNLYVDNNIFYILVGFKCHYLDIWVYFIPIGN